MIGTGMGVDVAEALAGLSRASRSLTSGAQLEPILGEIVEAAAHGAGAEIAAIWLPAQDGMLVGQAVWTSSRALAAEIEELRADSVESAAQIVRDRLGSGAIGLTVPLEADGRMGSLELVRRSEPFERDAVRVASLAADLASLAARMCADGRTANGDSGGAIEVAGEALAAVADDAGAPARVARLAAAAAGADGALVWRLRAGGLQVDGRHGALEPDEALKQTAAARLGEHRAVAVDEAPAGSEIVTLQLGQPPLGALQLLFPPGRAPGDHGLTQLASFAVRAADALRRSESARAAGVELERSRALLAVVGEAIARLSLSHTLDTAIERVADLLGADRVAVYLREEGRTVVAASRRVSGPHEAVADVLLEIALASRHNGSIVEVDSARDDERLERVRAQAGEAGIDSTLALPLLIAGEPIGLLAVYPRHPRPLSENETALLTALAAQLAVAVQNARLHERAKELGGELEGALEAEREAAKRLHALYEISRSFAQSLSLETTLEVLAESIVNLLEVDAAVIRMPDERRLELTARAVHVNDERVDAAVRALLARPQPLPSPDLLDLLEQRRPLLLDSARAEAMGGALGLLAPFLRKGSTAAVVPIATSSELLATLTLVSLHPGRQVAGEIVDTALSIAGQAALAIDNARLYGQQKAFADTMQRSLLPQEPPALPGLEIGDVYESAARLEVGGDVYDYVILPDGRLAVVLGDVTGHGVDATADMAMAKFVFRSLAREHTVPGEFLAVANDVVSSEIGAGRFITMLELVVDLARGEVACAGGGHPEPRLVLPDGAVTGIAAKGLALGIEGGQTYETVTVDFPPGAIVVAYTDGVVEARRAGELYGVARLDALLAEQRSLPPQELALAALAACREWTGGELSDDVALVVIKRSEPQR
jgi:serine phosphatase RsbU (regulator of sigma subunit)